MQRLTVTFDDDLMGEIDRFMTARGYSNRSEALRDLARSGLAHDAETVGETRACIATLTFAYDVGTRSLPERLAAALTERRDLVLASLGRPIDATSIFETVVLEGETTEVRAFAERLIAERGVRNGRLIVVAKGE